MKFEISASFPSEIIKIGSWIYELADQGQSHADRASKMKTDN